MKNQTLRAISAGGLGAMLAVSALVPAGCQGTPTARGQTVSTDPAEQGPAFTVDNIRIDFDQPVPGLTAEDLVQRPVRLGVIDGVYVAPGTSGAQISSVPLESDEPRQFTAAALYSVAEQLVRRVNEHGVIGVFIAPAADDITGSDDPAGWSDERAEGDRALDLMLYVGRVTNVRTVSTGSRLAENSVNHPAHERIRANSPVSPATRPADGSAPADNEAGLLRRDDVERYTEALSRHPGRRVDVALSADETEGGVVLDYLVAESKPWTIYLQASNTGTEDTDEWRERVGFIHNQVTGNDDIFSLEYSTVTFETHAVAASYELPLIFPQRVRLRAFGLYSEFDASDVGFQNQDFDGTEINAGGEIIFNFLQQGDLFLDAVFGARWQHAEVDNRIGGVTLNTGEASFAEPYLGLRLERLTPAAPTFGSLTMLAGFTDADQEDLDGLRLDADDTFYLLQGDLGHSFYLEPMLRPTAFRDGGLTTLSHELAFSARGQYAFDRRLIPQNEQTAGGFFSVRGYPESAAVGDSAIVGTIEYRWHVPQSLPVPTDEAAAAQLRNQTLFGQPFAYRPTTPYGRADWDLIFRTFVDAGYTENSEPFVFETDDELLSAGVGLELQVKTYLRARVDYGIALTDLEDAAGNPEVESGDGEFHFLVTVAF